MATANLDVAVKVKGLTDLQKLERRMKALEDEVTRLTKQLPKAENGIRGTGRAAATATGNIQRMGVAIRTTLGPIVGLYAAFNFLNKSLQVTSQRQVDVAKLTNGLKNLGATASDFERLQVAADKFGNTTLFDQEDATRAFALLTSFQRIGVDSYERVTKAASDLATVTGQDLKSAQIQLAKALEDPAKRVTDLARSGTVFTEQQKAQIKVLQESGRLFEAQNLILKEIEKQYGGAAEAAGSAGLAGALDSLGEATRDFQEQLASSTLLIDGATEAIKLLTDAVIKLGKDLRDLNTVFEAAAILAKEAGLGAINLGKGIEFVQQAALNSIPGLKQMLWLYERIVAVSGAIVNQSKGTRNFGGDYASQERELFKAAGGWSPYKPKPTLPTVPTGSVSGGSGTGSKKRTSKDDLAKIAQLAYGPQIIAAAKANSIDPRLLAGLVQVESGFRNNAVSSAGAAGLTQLMPGTAAELGVTDRFNPMQNLMGGAKYLRKMIDMFGDVTAGLRAYNQGPGNQQRYPGGVVQEAVQYPGKVLSAAAGFGFDGQGMADASVSGLEAMEKQREIAARILADAKERLSVAQANLEIEQAVTPIQAAQLQTIENKRQIEEEYKDLLKKAVDDQAKTTLEQAKSIELQLEEVKLEKQIKELREGAVQSITDEIAHLEAKLVGKEKEYLLEKEIARLKQAGVPADQATALVQRREELQQQLDMLEQTKQSWQSLANTIESEIGSAMSSAIVGLIDGTQTAQEAFSQMFKNIGKAFIDMATQMIAKALVMKALGILTGGAGGGGGGSTFGSFGTGHSMQFSGLFSPSYEGGGYTGNAPRSGGIDGKGGFPAILHPQETVIDHHGAMGRYSAGGAGGGGTRTIRFESTVINNVEYVTTEQAMAMSRQAADDGAKRGAIGGHARSMSTLKNSRSQRAKLGIR